MLDRIRLLLRHATLGAAKLSPASAVTLVVPLICAAVAMAQEPHGALIAGGDGRLPELNPSITFEHLRTIWDQAEGFGKNDSLARPILLPIVLLDLVFAKFGLGATGMNHLWPACVALLQAFYTMRLARVILPSCTAAALAFVGLATLLNPLQLLIYHTPYLTTSLGIALAPGLIALTVQHARRPRAKSLLEFLGLCVANTASAVNYGIVGTQLVLLVGVAAAVVITASRRRRAALAVAQLATVYLLPNLAFFVPAYGYLSYKFHSAYVETSAYSDSTLSAVSAYSGLWRSLRLVGGYLFANNVGSRPFIGAGASYMSSPVLVLATLTLPALAVSATIAGVLERRSEVTLVAAATLLALLTATGTSPPTGALFAWSFSHVPVLHALRDSYSKMAWLVALGYALLAGFALDSLRRRGPKSFFIASALSYAGLVIGAWPILTGHLFWQRAKVVLPERYLHVARWFNNGHRGRILEMPVAPDLFDTYYWGYVGAGTNYNLIENAIIAPVFDFLSEANAGIDSGFRNVHTDIGDREAAYVLGAYAVPYVLYDASIDVSFFGPAYAARLHGPLPRTRVAARFGSVNIYRVDGSLVNPLVYVPSRIITGPTDLRELGLACRLLNGCANAAIVPAHAAAEFPRDQVAEFAAGSAAYRVRAPRQFWSTYDTPPLVHLQAAPTEGVEASGVSNTLTIVDYGNSSVGPGQAATEKLLAFGTAAPIRLYVSAAHDRGSRASLRFTRVFESEAPYILCARPGEDAWHDIVIDGREIGSATGLLALAYSSDGVRPGVFIADLTDRDGRGNPVNSYFVPLIADERTSWFTRVFALTGKERAASLVFRLSALGLDGGCARFEPVLVAETASPPLWLSATARSFHMTAPYFAYHPAIFEATGDSLVRPSRYRAASHATIRAGLPLSDVSPQWSEPEDVDPQAGAPGYAVMRRDLGSAPAAEQLDTYGSRYDVHAYFAHLLPGARYRLRFGAAYAGSREVAVLAGDGQLLEADFVRRQAAKRAPIILDFTLPPTDSDAMAYFYAGEADRFTRSAIARPELTLLSIGEWPIAVRRGRRVAVPLATSVTALRPSGYEVRFRRAPSRFLLVMLESADPGWRVDAPRGVTAERVIVNLYCDGWIMTGRVRSYTVKITYDGTEWGRMGALFALLDLGMVLISVATAGRLSEM